MRVARCDDARRCQLGSLQVLENRHRSVLCGCGRTSRQPLQSALQVAGAARCKSTLLPGGRHAGHSDAALLDSVSHKHICVCRRCQRHNKDVCRWELVLSVLPLLQWKFSCTCGAIDVEGRRLL